MVKQAEKKRVIVFLLIRSCLRLLLVFFTFVVEKSTHIIWREETLKKLKESNKILASVNLAC